MGKYTVIVYRWTITGAPIPNSVIRLQIYLAMEMRRIMYEIIYASRS